RFDAGGLQARRKRAPCRLDGEWLTHALPQSLCRPCERRDPYAAAFRYGCSELPVRATTDACGYGSLLSQGRQWGHAAAPCAAWCSVVNASTSSPSASPEITCGSL